MSQNTLPEQNRTNSSTDEIDLGVFFKFVKIIFLGVKRAIVRLFQIIWKRILLIVLATVLGVGLGYLLSSLIRPHFTSSMTLVLAAIRNEFVEEQLNRLLTMVNDKNYQGVATNLDISLTDASNIKDINIATIDLERISADSILVGAPIRIELSLYENTLFTKMEPALTSYLENNRYFTKQKKIKQQQVENMINKLKGDISSMDSLRKHIVNPRGPVNGFVYGEPIDPTSLFRQSLEMYQQQVKYEADLEMIDNIQVVNGFSPRSNPSGPNKLIFMIIGGLAMAFIGLIVAIRLETKSRPY